jgi:hypothetical protein
MTDPSPGRAALRITEPGLPLLDFISVGRCLTRASGTSHYTETAGTRMLVLSAVAPAQRTDFETHHCRFACSLRERMLR